ncbi:hypothetical protein PR202_gb27586 [Eleusine coracana subsp. coracana]|uniref:VQ domain-containing protein n=1 Tax=Eleusine coracana subsp. coracana TaxID=191504 RepID=A0AAV5FS70_ELECO|nr:hypothetical protein QOZ80_6AG0541680 [Eleusine coracana subsp. coracana]GJN38534.1 hypothetical protein PR202_gb27586 [Eleusine coracana subsp. coracana]
MAMAVKQQQHDVKVKFIETQFISSDAASFKSVVQRLTGKHSPPASTSHTAPAPPQPQRPRPCRRPAFADDAGWQQQAGYWAQEQSGNNGQHQLTMSAPKQEPQRLEELYELCDFSDLLYATGAARRDGGFPY